MSLENGGNPESPETPKTPEEQIIEKYLSFQSSGTKQEKITRAHNALANENIRKYATALIEAANKEGWKNVKDISTKVRNAMVNDAEALEIPVSVFGKDVSWAMLDLGQRYHYYLHPDEPGHIDKDKRVDPFAETDEATNVRWDISDRQLAYQARRAYISNHAKSKEWKARVDSNEELYQKALPMLRDKGQRDGQLSFQQETKLGDILHRIAEEISESQSPSAPASAETPPASVPAAAPNEQTDVPPAADAPTAPVDATTNTDNAEPKLSQDDMNTIAREMRRSLKLDRGRYSEKGRERQHEAKALIVETDEENKILQDNHASHAKEKYSISQEPITPGYLGKVALAGTIALPIVGGYYIGREVGKTFWKSITGMFDVLKKLAKGWFSFKALNKSVDDAGGAGGHGAHANDNHKPGAHANDNHKAGGGHGHESHDGGHPDAGGHHEGGGHAAGHGHAGGGHGAHGKGGHGKKPSRRRGKKAVGGGGGGHGGGHH